MNFSPDIKQVLPCFECSLLPTFFIKIFGCRPVSQELKMHFPVASDQSRGRRKRLRLGLPREIDISSSLGEAAPQRLPWTAATGQITATGGDDPPTNSPDSSFVQLPSLMFYFWSVTTPVLRFCKLFTLVSQQRSCRCLPTGMSCVCKNRVGERDLVFFP